MLRDRPTLPKTSRLEWFLWWRIDPAELENQIADYDRGVRHSARGWSLLALLFSAGVTVLFIAIGSIPATAYVDCAIMLVLGAFIYFGHRWAMIGAMVAWSFEKLMGAIGSPSSIIIGILWWTAYMHIFYLAFRVEQARARGMFEKPEEAF